jgi:hypothetical protein
MKCITIIGPLIVADKNSNAVGEHFFDKAFAVGGKQHGRDRVVLHMKNIYTAR